jgi:hypothetical protein
VDFELQKFELEGAIVTSTLGIEATGGASTAAAVKEVQVSFLVLFSIHK